MNDKTTLQQMEDEISKKQNQKTQNINVRISPATKADVITKAAELNLTLSEYVEYVLTNEEKNNLRVLGERRKGEELKEVYENEVLKLKENFTTLETEKENLNSRMEKLTNVLFVERIRNAENAKNTFELINLMKETIIRTEEMKDRLNFFAENQKLNDILSAFVGEEFTYYSNGKKETLVPETVEDVFLIIVSDFHSKLGLHKNKPQVEVDEKETE